MGWEVVPAIFGRSSATRRSGTYTAEFSPDERTTSKRICWIPAIRARTHGKEIASRIEDFFIKRRSKAA